MRVSLLIIILFLVPGGFLQSQVINREPLSDRITGYRIEAELDPGTKTVTATMEAFWVNKSADVVPDIRLHMYMNAFRNNRSTFYRESQALSGYRYRSSLDGSIELKKLADWKGTDLLPRIKFISPDDGNPFDMTVIRVILPDAAKPGDTVRIKADFETKLPSSIIRTGYNNDFFFVAQWFPKFGVYEPAGMRFAKKGGWNCHQFHAESEFYSDHSVYDVKITVPKEYVVGSGGMLIDESEADPDGKNKTLTYRAEDIVDFAWTAWPGYKVFKDKWGYIDITLLLPEERADQVSRQFTAVKNAMEYLARNVGPYPWPYLTIADPPAIGSGSGGMEYTTFFTSESFDRMPSWLYYPEIATVHEFGHAYFMGILASNEFEEPWMDEGMTSFWEERIMGYYYGENSSMLNLPFIRLSDKSVSRMSYINSDSKQAASNNEFSWNYPHGTYGIMSYYKASELLYTLMGIIGEDTMNEIYREYYKKWAFRHPSGGNFIDVVNEVVNRRHNDRFGSDMNWFFDQTLYGTGICDFEVTGIMNRRNKVPGNTGEPADTSGTVEQNSDSLFTAIAQLERAGDVILPVEVLVHFNNGDEILEIWDGRSRSKDFTYIGTREIDWVKIDPEYKITLDVNYLNNSMTLVPDRVPVRRIINKITTILQFFISVITL